MFSGVRIGCNSQKSTGGCISCQPYAARGNVLLFMYRRSAEETEPKSFPVMEQRRRTFQE